MTTVSIDELKRNLSSLIDQASAGVRIVITKHRRPVALLSAANLEHVHRGARFGRGGLTLVDELTRARRADGLYQGHLEAALAE